MSVDGTTRQKVMGRLGSWVCELGGVSREHALPSASLRELGLDSVAVLGLVARFIEDEGLDPESLDADLGALRTLGDLASLLEGIARETAS